ncbi:MAG: peptidoglycan bridge formation glycyltransferase FemA/FemB family protein [Anaerolineae bacterium]|nr:peptidoglycan bridge formation glycyltransferase FemA/FemB family protein [Anaerolineae bacterium]
MNAQTLAPGNARWMEFISKQPAANIFHHPFWLLNLEDSYQYRTFIVAVEDESRQIVAGVPLAEVNSRITGRRWVSLPFSDHCAPLFESETALDALTNALIALWRKNNIPKVELRWAYPSRPEIQATQQHVLHTAQFCKTTEEDMLGQFRRKIRYCIRTTIERGVRVEMGTTKDHLQQFYRLQTITRKRHGIPVQPWHYFENLGRNVLEKGLGGVLLAYAGDACIAGEVFLHFQQTVTMKYGASGNINLTDLHPNHLLDWEVIKWGCTHGYKNFDAGRSAIDNEGLRQYKAKWGYMEQPLIYSYIGSMPKEEGKMIDIINAVIRRSPLWVCRLAGELLYRHIG